MSALRLLLVTLLAVATHGATFPTVSSAAPAPPPIVATSPPTVSGSAVYRETLRADSGEWTPDGLTTTYQWLSGDEPLVDETRSRLRLRLAHIGAPVSVAVTATDAAGQSATVVSAATGPVRKATMTLLERPRLSGVPRWQRTLRVDAGVWDLAREPRPRELSYRWLRDGTRIRGARTASYVLSHRDVGRAVRARVIVRREGYRRAVAHSRAVEVRHRVGVRRRVTYDVRTRGDVHADLGVFRRQVQQTYDDARGWRSAGIAYRRVARGGDFTVVLAEASTLPSFSPICSVQWSCRVGRYVVINQDRWLHSSPAWVRAGLPLRSYRHMVVNHETGHWLGHGHLACPGPGRLAPVMMQQSKGLAGCRFNPFPLPSERWWGG